MFLERMTTAQAAEAFQKDPIAIIPVGSTEQHGPLWRGIDYLMNLRERRVLQPVQKSTYLKLCWLGAFGIHRMYAKQWFTAAVYLATCWTGISIAMTLIDVMAVLPMKADEKGAIYL